MSMKLRILATLLVGLPAGVGLAGLTASGAIAQDDPSPQLFRPTETPIEAMEREFFDHEKSILRSRDLGGISSAAHLIGIPRFSENGIIEDAASVNRLHRYLREQQAYSGPTLRAADLTSPFTTSVQFLPMQTSMSQPSSNAPSFERPAMPAPEMPRAPGAIAPSPVAPAPSTRPDPGPRPPVQGRF
jgi:hypothetical protein